MSEYQDTRPSLNQDKAYWIEYSEQLEKKVEVISGLLHAAKCPTCEGIGAYYDNMGEVRQCQWCYDAKAALKQEGE